MATPSAQTTKKTERAGIDLETFSDVRMFKHVPTVAEVTSVNDALARLGNDHAKLLSIIRDGLESHEIEKARNEPTGWKLYDAEGKETDQEYNGTLVDSEILNPLVLTIAKNSFGYDEADSITDVEKKRAAKRKAKEEAQEFIGSAPKLLQGLKARQEAKNREDSAKK